MNIPQHPCASAFLQKGSKPRFLGSFVPQHWVTLRWHPELYTLNLGALVFSGHLEKGFGVGLGLDYLSQRAELQSHQLCPDVLPCFYEDPDDATLDNPMG